MKRERVTDERIKELREQGLPRATAEVFPDTYRDNHGIPSTLLYERKTPIAEHAARFLPPQADCPNCESNSIEWTIQHGVAACFFCGWPIRVYHYFGAPNEGEEQRVQVRLWLHPDSLIIEGDEPRRA